MGTELQKNGMNPGEQPELFGADHPEVTEKIHRAYVAAGSRIIYANTFGANARKLAGTGRSVPEIVEKNIAAARKAAGGRASVALDIGPTGEMTAPLGTLSFEDTYEIFREIVTAGEQAGADLIVCETFSDLSELRAALLAAKENTSLPVFATMTFEERGRTFTGCLPESFAVVAEGLGADAVGVNCSLGPAGLMPILRRIAGVTSLPLIMKANAGLPDARDGHYAVGAAQFAEEMSGAAEIGVRLIGGCCGTDRSYIAALKERFRGLKCAERQPEQAACFCSATHFCAADRVRVIGERLNPTGKKRFRQALADHDLDYVLAQAVEEEEAGADILDVNVGAPGIDEPGMMKECVLGLMGTVDLPLQIDSGNAGAVEAGLRVFAGKAIVNSVNGEAAKLVAVLPLVKKYGAAVVGLTMDENGIPETAEERLRIAEKIRDACRSYGIPDRDVLIDCLTMTVSAAEKSAAQTLRAVRMVKEKLGLKTVLGVSNISFGLPERGELNRTFLAAALEAGLDLPIMNPNTQAMTDTVCSFLLLKGYDPGCEAYIGRFQNRAAEKAAAKGAGGGTLPAAAGRQSGKLDGAEQNGTGVQPGAEGQTAGSRTAEKQTADPRTAGSHTAEEGLRYAVVKGLQTEAVHCTKELLTRKTELELIDADLIPALDYVGTQYETGAIFLPQLLRSAEAAEGAFGLVRERIAESGKETVNRGTILLATVKGDIHDIGKNIVKAVLSNYGYRILDLGRDVPPEKIVETAVRENVRLVGLSALMTTTLPAMRETIAKLRESGHACSVMVGGAVLTPEYAAEIGADFYARDAKRSADIAAGVFGAAAGEGSARN